MPWLAFAILAIVSISVANLFQRLAMKEEGSDPIISTIIVQSLLGIFVGTFALIRGFEVPSLRILFPYAIASSALYAFGSILFFKAIKIIEASEAALLSTFGAVVSIIAAYLALEERLNANQFLGVIAIIASIIVVKFERQSLKFNRGSMMTLMGTSLFGLAIVIDTFAIRTYDAISYLTITSTIPALMQMTVFPKKTILLVHHIRQRVNANLVIFSALYSITAISFFLALEAGALASQMSTIGKTQTVLTVILAAIFLKETSHLGRKALSAALVTLGIFLIR